MILLPLALALLTKFWNLNLCPFDGYCLTVEPQLSAFLDYPDFFSDSILVMNIIFLVTIKIRIHMLFQTTGIEKCGQMRGFIALKEQK